MHAMAQIWKSEDQPLQGVVSLSLWNFGVELRSSGLVPDALPLGYLVSPE